MSKMTQTEMLTFLDECLYSEDLSYVEKFKKFGFTSQIYFIQEMLNVFRNWNETDFKKFSERNVYKGIFDNLTFDAWTYLFLNIHIYFKFNVSNIHVYFTKYIILDKKPILYNYFLNVLDKNDAEIEFGVDHNKNTF